MMSKYRDMRQKIYRHTVKRNEERDGRALKAMMFWVHLKS